MAAYSLDFWKTLFPYLALWRRLSLEQRLVARWLQPGYQDPHPALATLPPDLSEQLFETDAKGRQRPRPEFHRLLGFLQRIGQWSPEHGIEVPLQVQQLTTYEQRLALTGLSSGTATEVITAALVRRIQDGWFVKTLLASDSPGYYLAAIGGWLPEGQLYTEAHHDALRSWVGRELENGPGAAPLVADAFRVSGSEVPPEEMIHLLINHGLVLLALSPKSIEAVVQAPTPVEAVRQGPDNLALRKFKGLESFARPFLIDDVDAYLRAVKADPAPLLSDGINVPVAHHRKVARTFLPLPFEVSMSGWEAEYRASAAWWVLTSLDLISVSGHGRKTWKASLDPKGEAWLKLAREKKLESLLQELPCGRREAHRLGIRFAWLGEFAAHPFPYAALSNGLFEWMDAAIARLEEPFDFTAWIKSAIKGFNPLIAAAEQDLDLGARWMRWDAPPQHVYERLLHHQVARLCSIGALLLSVDEEGRLGLSLTGVGRWLYGLSDSWCLPEEGRPVAVVGGDFTVTLLESALGFESDLLAFADQVGGSGGAGTTYKITRQSVQKAVHGGLSVENMLQTLRPWAKNVLPANVVHEIGAWAGSRRSLIIREAILVESEDALIVAEALSQFPKDFERVSPTVLKYIGTGNRAALGKRLGKKGFFTD